MAFGQLIYTHDSGSAQGAHRPSSRLGAQECQRSLSGVLAGHQVEDIFLGGESERGVSSIQTAHKTGLGPLGQLASSQQEERPIHGVADAAQNGRLLPAIIGEANLDILELLRFHHQCLPQIRYPECLAGPHQHYLRHFALLQGQRDYLAPKSGAEQDLGYLHGGAG